MPCWFYDKKALFNTPSIQDGIDHKTECQYRKEGAQLIIQIGSQMELGYNTLATGIVYFHRFYMFHSFRTFSPYITACCCLFLAGKAEETPKKSKDIIKIAKTFLSEDKLLLLGRDPREEVMTMEKILLQTMKFDLKVRHPYCFLLKYAKCLRGDKRKKQRMVQMAWTFINDSLCTTLSIQWEPEVIAIAVMHLAGKLVRFKVSGWTHRKPSHTHWWEIFVEDLSVQVVEDICHQVLDLYSPMSRYIVIKSSKSMPAEPENSLNSQSVSPPGNIDMRVAVRDPRLENGTASVTANAATSLKDPRLESGSIFVNSHFEMNTLDTPILVASTNVLPGTMIIKQSPSTPTVPQFKDQLLQDNSQELNRSFNVEREIRDISRLPFYMGNYSTPTVSSVIDPLTNVGQPMLKKGFNNVEDSQTAGSRGFDFGNNNNNNNNNDYNDNGMNRRKGFGCMHNYNRDYNDNRPMGNRGFRNRGRNNHFGFSRNRFKKRSFENNNHSDGDDRTENRPMGTRGFGNSRNNNRRYDENKPLGNRNFGNANDNNNKFDENKLQGTRGFGNVSDNNNRYDENKPLGTRGFGNSNHNNNRNYNENRPMGNRGFENNNDNNGRHSESKLLLNKGFGNSDSYNNNGNGNDSKPSMRFNRANRFQRSGPYPRKFNNNYENDRYSHGNRDTSNDSMKDALGKVVDKQRFYHPNPSNDKTKDEEKEEEESWD